MPNQKIVTEAALSAIASDIKTALSGKANSNDVYLKSQTYNKTEIDNALDLKADKSELYNVYPTEQESGGIAHFTDGADNIPVKSLVSQIVAVESGSGTKSPDNPYTISGFDSGVITRCGKNYIDESDIVQGDFNTVNGGDYANATRTRTQTHIAIPQGTYQVLNKEHWEYVVYVYDMNNAFIDAESIKTWQAYGTPFTVGANRKVRIGWRKPDNTTMTPDDIHNAICTSTVNTYTFAFGQTVYGGHFDNKGNLVVTYGMVDLGSLEWNEITSGVQTRYFQAIIDNVFYDSSQLSYLCECYSQAPIGSTGSDTGFYITSTSRIRIRDVAYATVYDFKTGMTGMKFVYPLENPIILSITSQDIPTLLGENNIFSNCGDVEVNYHADIGLYIDKKISSLAQG